MARNDEFGRILGSIDQINGSLHAARNDQTAMSNLLTSAEYELQLVRRQLRGADYPIPRAGDVTFPASAPAVIGEGDAGAKFAQKLRHPDGLRHGWWTVLASDA